MSKKTTGLKQVALQKPASTKLPKRTVDTEKLEKSTSRIHSKKKVRVSLDMDPDFYAQVKHDSFDAQMTLKAYLLNLVEIAYKHKDEYDL